MDAIILLLHVLGATIWTGGHIVLVVVILPKVLRDRSPTRLLEFESVYEKIGMPALLIQVITGLWLVYHMIPDVFQWFDYTNPLTHPIMAKLILLLLTISIAAHARLRVIPALSENNLVVMAWHIVAVTTLSILFVVVGVSFRTGWLY
ncbi:copper resistance protein CopD [Methylophaga nitratireducenticrescens]|uniref:Copper export protein n=1 Tax=Methylophaga nitratireducenticrescens TaxID=754476 RepID=I1XG08_METNJ|nr:copper resistance protein CopD [Methylophaga nitratireducenticrescens]AFI83327.1 copper resistance protein CopD [Methylophaga nitratireducenticrescens]AUZ83447.1 copper resistance protein CopD [Methylophaga nitratireducenticrescens]